MVSRFNETTLNYAQTVRAHAHVYVCPNKKRKIIPFCTVAIVPTVGSRVALGEPPRRSKAGLAQ